MAGLRWLLIAALVAAPAGCSRAPDKRAESLARSLGGRVQYDNGRLFRLELQRSRMLDSDLARFVEWVPDIEEIDCSQTRITDDGVAMLASFPKLRKIALSGTKISPAAVVHLGRCQALRDLYLLQTPLDDEAVDELAGLTALRKIGLSGTALSEEGVERLRQALPQTMVGADGLATKPRPAGAKRGTGGS